MTLETLSLSNFTAFEEAYFEFSPGLNVLIGANSTGKTHAMKAIYSLLKACEKIHQDQISSSDSLRIKLELQEKLIRVFKPDSIGRLVRCAIGNRNGIISLVAGDANLQVEITPQNQFSYSGALLAQIPLIYLPSREFLSINEGFIAAYQKRETAFDETYYDLSVALNASPLRGPKLKESKNLSMPLETAIGGKVVQESGRFYIESLEGKIEAHLVAEGYRKLASLLYLLNNGSLTQNGILFWDEPEANLNPKLVTVVVKALQSLAESGVQIFVATHDYLLSQELSALAEYSTGVAIKFFCLYRPYKFAGVQVESAATLAEIEHNPILEEFAAHYDREVERSLVTK